MMHYAKDERRKQLVGDGVKGRKRDNTARAIVMAILFRNF